MWHLSKLQRYVNESYPPTMTYDVVTLNPMGALRERCHLIKRECPRFFKGKRLLDIGCAQGFFALRHRGAFRHITAIDIDAASIEAAQLVGKRLKTAWIDWQVCSFMDYASSSQFDRVFIGNGPHHLFREIGSHDWIAKVAALCCEGGVVLTEGPVDTTCKDIHEQPDIYPPEQFDLFVDKMEEYFSIIKIVDSVSYTPGRKLILWRTKQRADLSAPRSIRKEYKHDGYVHNNAVDILVAGSSPYATDVLAVDDSGWWEQYLEQRPLAYGESQRDAWQQHCCHQRYLSQLGYMDIDPATINMFAETLMIFDKSGVMPIQGLTDKHVDVYFRFLDKSYGCVDQGQIDKIRLAMMRKDAKALKEAFAWESPTS